MLVITEYIEEVMFPSLSEAPLQPVEHHGPRADVGVARFNLPQVALMKTLKTNIEHMKEDSVVASEDYKRADERNENGGTDPDSITLPQFNIKNFISNEWL